MNPTPNSDDSTSKDTCDHVNSEKSLPTFKGIIHFIAVKLDQIISSVDHDNLLQSLRRSEIDRSKLEQQARGLRGQLESYRQREIRASNDGMNEWRKGYEAAIEERNKQKFVRGRTLDIKAYSSQRNNLIALAYDITGTNSSTRIFNQSKVIATKYSALIDKDPDNSDSIPPLETEDYLYAYAVSIIFPKKAFTYQRLDDSDLFTHDERKEIQIKNEKAKIIRIMHIIANTPECIEKVSYLQKVLGVIAGES